MRRENKSRYALLGILSLRPMSGYDIKQTIEASLSNFWSESYGQIYPILKELVADGLTTSHTEVPAAGPHRRVYTITQAGREELRRWLARPADYSPGRIEILLKLFFGWHLPLADNRRQVEAYRHLHLQLLGQYDTIEQWLTTEHAAHPGLPYWLVTVSYGQHVNRALLAWCDETLERLVALEAATPMNGETSPATDKGGAP